MSAARRDRLGRQLKQKRQQRREGRERERFSNPLTSKQAAHIARAYARAELRPLERSIQGEIRGSVQRGKEIGGWYDKAGAEINKLREEGAAADAMRDGATTQRLAAAGAQDAAQLQQLAAQDKAFAQLVGGPTNATAMRTAAAGNTALAGTRAALAAPSAAASASFNKYLGQRGVAARERGIEARLAQGQVTAGKRQDLLAAKRERGAAFVNRLQELRKEAGDRAVQNQAFGAKAGYNRALETQSRLGLRGDLASANAQVAASGNYRAGDERTAAATERSANASAGAKKYAAKKYGESVRQQGKNSKSGGGGYGVREAIRLARAGLTGHQTEAQVIDYLVNRGVSEAVARKAARKLASR